MATHDDMRERLERVEKKVDQLVTREGSAALATKDDLTAFATKDDLKAFATKDDLKAFATRQELTEGFDRLSERMYGVEERMDAMNSRIDVTRDELRGDIKLAMERIDSLRELIERKASEDQKERATDQRLLHALVKDHNRRLRALERLELRRRAQAAPH
jgi:hypothetical protein